jgi:flavin-dependent dehydrogenase
VTWDVLIRGGGIAGSAAAVLLARRGFAVVLFEKSRASGDKVCGEFLSPEALPILEDLVPAFALAGARPVRRAALTAPNGARVRFDLPRPGLALSRRRLDSRLLEAAEQAGATIRQGVTVQRFDGSPQAGFTAIGPRQEPLACGRLALDASGRVAGSRRRSSAGMIGLKAHFRPARIDDDAVELFGVPGGYCGVCAVEDDLLNVCLAIEGDTLRAAGSPDALFAAVCRQSPSLARRLAGTARVQERFVAAAALDYRPLAPPPGPVLRLGDAAGLIAPLTGDGMAMALRAAEIATPIVAARLRGEISAHRYTETWAGAWRSRFAARRLWGSGLQALLTRPAAAGAALRLLAHAPALAQFLYARTREA